MSLIRILGGGWYGCHLAAALSSSHIVELHERAGDLFSGASGANPARLHLGFHYPRSQATRQACREHFAQFMGEYGDLTRAVPVNLYCIAQQESLIDFGTYRRVLEGLEFVEVYHPSEFGLRHIEGALLTGERHLVIEQVREYFRSKLSGQYFTNVHDDALEAPRFDWTIDCTFCANGAINVDRYEPCVTVLLEGPSDRAVTVMDGPFPSIYPWNPARHLSSLTSARWTPLARCASRAEADEILRTVPSSTVEEHVDRMREQMGHYWPESLDLYTVADVRLAIRALPKSAADARLVDVSRAGERLLRIRAGKIDAVIAAEKMVREIIEK